MVENKEFHEKLAELISKNLMSTPEDANGSASTEKDNADPEQPTTTKKETYVNSFLDNT